MVTTGAEAGRGVPEDGPTADVGGQIRDSAREGPGRPEKILASSGPEQALAKRPGRNVAVRPLETVSHSPSRK